MTKEEFKARWESTPNGGGITIDEIADCAVAWGISQQPRCSRMDRIIYLVVKAANTIDCEEFNPELNQDEDDNDE
jgi:hypothetical protein